MEVAWRERSGVRMEEQAIPGVLSQVAFVPQAGPKKMLAR